MNFEPSLRFAQDIDAADDLAMFRQKFVLAEPELIYMDGNSLGRLPHRTVGRLESLIQEGWGRDLIRSWNQGWFEAPQRLGDKVGQLLGAAPGQVVVSDSTSVNLFKLVMAALALRPDRDRVVSDVLNFTNSLQRDSVQKSLHSFWPVFI